MKKPAGGVRFSEFPDPVFKCGGAWRCCQTNEKSSLVSGDQGLLDGQKLAPFLEHVVAAQFQAGS